MGHKATLFFEEYKFLCLILFLAAFLRFFLISSNPPALNWDEVSHGYNAYSILKTGKDEWGVKFPIIFKAYGDFKLPVYIYLTAISEFFFGLNSFSVRLTSVLAGLTTVIFTYLLVKQLFGIEEISLLSALLVAIEPWSLFLSRGAFEANLALFFIVAGIYFFLKGISQSTYYLLLSTMLLGLSVWTYNSARVFVPVLLLTLTFLYRKDLKSLCTKYKNICVFSILIFALFFIPMVWQLLNPVGQVRYGKVSIIDAGAIGQIIELRNKSSLPPLVRRMIYNRPVYFLTRFISNWASHYSGNFLFFQGGTNYQFSIPNFGLIYQINAIFLIIGLFSLIRKRTKGALIILSLFFLGSIPSSLTREAPHVLRAITMLPSPMIITSVGVVTSFNWLKKKIIINLKSLAILYLIILSIFLANYLSIYFGEYRNNFSWSWQYGYKEITEYSKENYGKYDKIIVTKKYGEPHEFFLFNWPWNPEEYRNDPNLTRFYQSYWYWVDEFDKFYFVNDWDIPKEEWQDFKLESGGRFNCKNLKCLLVTSPDNYPKGWNKIKTINFLDGKSAFDILENI